MLSYCLKCRKNTESKNPKVQKKDKKWKNNAFSQNLSKSKKLMDNEVA